MQSALKNNFLTLFLPAMLLCACNERSRTKQQVQKEQKKEAGIITHSISVLPFQGVDTSLLSHLVTGIRQQLMVDVHVLPVQALPSFAFYAPRQRYIADSLLVFLKQQNRGQAEKIIGVTIKDISTKKPPHDNWGVLGLGSCPGEACVISSFRAGKKKVTNDQYTRRMITLALHELGHTYGLEHCPAADCLMKDAQGKMNLDDSGVYCDKCRNYLKAKGVLR